MIDAPSRYDTLQKMIRDSAVHEALTTHKDAIEGNERIVHEIASLAVHLALTNYAQRTAADVAIATSYFRVQADKLMFAHPTYRGLPK